MLLTKSSGPQPATFNLVFLFGVGKSLFKLQSQLLCAQFSCHWILKAFLPLVSLTTFTSSMSPPLGLQCEMDKEPQGVWNLVCGREHFSNLGVRLVASSMSMAVSSTLLLHKAEPGTNPQVPADQRPHLGRRSPQMQNLNPTWTQSESPYAKLEPNLSPL